MTPEEFAQEARTRARALRALPGDLRRDLARTVRDDVAAPMAADISRGGSSVYARRVAPTARATVSAEARVVVGSTRVVASGGATARDLVYGTEFGGGRKARVIPARPGQRSHARRTTRQFARRPSHCRCNTAGVRVAHHL